MEKILRKVSVKDRLPERTKVYTNLGERMYEKGIFYELDAWTARIQPEYWYEEISLNKLTKERYEKAIEFCVQNGIEKYDVIYSALKIAAGLKEDEV
jgi:hypothetical protein